MLTTEPHCFLIVASVSLCCNALVKVDLKSERQGWFRDYHGGKDCFAAEKYIRDSFMKRNYKNKKIFIESTVATNTENIKKVFNACQEIILDANIVDSGF